LDGVALPASEPATVRPKRRTVAGYEGSRRTILVVDDDADNRQMLLQWLHPLGFATLEASNGHEALEQAAKRPDLIIMDLVMPLAGGGLQTIRSLRQRVESSTLPIIAASASVSKEDACKSRSAGADAFLPKPIDLTELQALLGSLLNITWNVARPEKPEAAD